MMPLMPPRFRVGDLVKLESIPKDMPSEVGEIFDFCLGKEFEIVGIDKGKPFLYVLDVSPIVDEKFGGFKNDIRVEQKHLTTGWRNRKKEQK